MALRLQGRHTGPKLSQLVKSATQGQGHGGWSKSPTPAAGGVATHVHTEEELEEGGVGYVSDEESASGEEEDEDELLSNATPLDDEEGSVGGNVLFEVQALGNFTGEEEGDLSFKEREILAILESSRDDGWFLAENALGERGVVPSNYVQRLPDEASRAASPTSGGGTAITPRRGRDLWAKLKQTVKQTSLADVLSALGAIPAGFRDSTLAKLLKDSPAYLTSSWVYPKPSPTGIALRDLKWNHAQDQLQPMVVKTTREFSVVAARMIPIPGKGVQILSRHVRIAVFNKNDMLSNIHTIRALWNPQEERTWKFASKTQTATNSLFHPVCILRVNSTDPNIELLFELCITFKREKSGEVGELSCGWSSLPLYEHSGNPTPNKTFELKVHGGTPFESGVEVDPARNMKASGGILPSILRVNQTPRLYVRLLNSSRGSKSTFNLLPPTVVTCSLYAKPITYFRYMVACSFLRGRLGLPLQSHVNRPSLNVFMRALDQPDVMDLTLGLVNERLKIARRADKQSLIFASKQLETVLLQHTYPLLYTPSLPEEIWADEDREKDRLQFIEDFSRKIQLSSLLAADTEATSINISEQSVQIKLVLGHSAQWRKRPTPEGYTHDWTVLVRGEDGQDIRHFVEKVVFFLHESFPKPRRIVKEPPYQVSESGYGSFMLPVEVHFRNKDEPKKVRFEYDLLLPNLNDPPINQIRSECLTFQNPSEEFRQKLLKAGGIVSGGPPVMDKGAMQQQKKRPAATGLESEMPKSKKKKLKTNKKIKGGMSSSESSEESDSSSDSESIGDDVPIMTKKGGANKKLSPNSWDTGALKRLHKQLNSLQDPQQLQEIVNIIEQTGLFNLTASTFDFDLCKLDDSTLDKLVKYVEPTS